MPRIFKHLTRTDRLRIEKCLNEGYTYRQIADVLRVHISTIYREIKKGEYQRLNGATYEFYPAYSPDIAEERYQANLSAKGADLKIGNDHEFAAYIQNKIKYENRSPAAALADIALEGRTFKTSPSPTARPYPMRFGCGLCCYSVSMRSTLTLSSYWVRVAVMWGIRALTSMTSAPSAVR